MFVAKKIKSLVNHFGFDIVRKIPKNPSNKVPIKKYLTLIDESVRLFEELHSFDFPKNERRNELLSKLLGTNISEGINILYYLNKSLKNTGDICEFGVAQGATSALMANEIMHIDEKNLWLFDSFKGLPKPTAKDILQDDIMNLGSIEAYAGHMSCPVKMVSGRLESVGFPISRTKIIEGFIEESIKTPNLPVDICFAYIDFDFYEPICIALNYLHDNMKSGAHIVVDDYNWFSTGAQTAVDEFYKDHQSEYNIFIPNERLGRYAILEKK